MRKTLYILGLLLVSITSGAQALPFAAADYDPAVLGKGGAFMTETTSSAYASFGNPAAVPFSGKNLDVAVGYTLWQPSSAASNILGLGASYLVKEKIGISLGLAYGMNAPYDIVDPAGNIKGTFKPSDIQINAGFSWLIMPYLSIGANLGYASSALAEGHSYGAFNADVMAMVKFGGLKASVGVRNLGTSVKSSSGDSFQLPSSVAAGVGYTLAAGEKLALDFNVDADYHFNGGVAVAGGVSCTVVEMATVRAGYRYGGNTVLPSYASVGAGLCLFGARIDLAYLIAGKNSPFANTLCVGAGFSF